MGKTRDEAWSVVNSEFPQDCPACRTQEDVCRPTCDVSVGDCYSCSARANWLMSFLGGLKTSDEAWSSVNSEFPEDCPKCNSRRLEESVGSECESGWRMISGTFTVEVGASSRDTRLRESFSVPAPPKDRRLAQQI